MAEWVSPSVKVTGDPKFESCSGPISLMYSSIYSFWIFMRLQPWWLFINESWIQSNLLKSSCTCWLCFHVKAERLVYLTDEWSMYHSTKFSKGKKLAACLDLDLVCRLYIFFFKICPNWSSFILLISIIFTVYTFNTQLEEHVNLH